MTAITSLRADARVSSDGSGEVRETDWNRLVPRTLRKRGSSRRYDEFINYASRALDTDAEVAGLIQLARGGRVLELGVGTGRVAIPLAATGLEVHAIELDPDMLDQLRSKPGSEAVTVHLGNMAAMDIDGNFDLIYAVFGTLFMLPTQDDQVRCFRQAAHKLTPNGKLFIEAFMPQPTRANSI